MNDYKEIIQALPFSEPFLFVDEIVKVDDQGITGAYTFRPESFFYQGHFKGNPVTPGVILTETMAQIGLVCLGIWLLQKETNTFRGMVALSNTNVDFFKVVMPGERVVVTSKKEYFRFNKLKCHVKMSNSKGEMVCKGVMSGMLIGELK